MSARKQAMERLRASRWTVPFALVVLLLPACSNDAGDGAETTAVSAATVAETTTTGATTTTTPPTTTTVPLEGHGPFDVTMAVVSHETTQDISVFAPDADGSWPVVYLLHGYEGNRQDMAITATELASHGTVVFAPDYRSTGSEEEMIKDLECGERYARSIAAEYGGDLDQPVTFVGDSYGASLVLGGGVSKGGGPDGNYDVCFTGVPDPDVIVGIAGCYYEVEGEKVWPVADMIVDNIDNVTLEPDLVLLVGADDPYCEPWQSEDAATTLQSVGYNVELVVIPGGNHSNVVFKAHVEGESEWVNVPNDPVGQQVVQNIVDAIDAAQP